MSQEKEEIASQVHNVTAYIQVFDKAFAHFS